MARFTGLSGSVSVDGVEVAHIVAWSMDYRGGLLSHQGASEDLSTKYITRGERGGSFACEADNSDAAQNALIGGLVSVSLLLTEESGETHSLSAITIPSVSVPRGGAVTRVFNFVETA